METRSRAEVSFSALELIPSCLLVPTRFFFFVAFYILRRVVGQVSLRGGVGCMALPFLSQLSWCASAA